MLSLYYVSMGRSMISSSVVFYFNTILIDNYFPRYA